jgi:hypothetical protein
MLPFHSCARFNKGVGAPGFSVRVYVPVAAVARWDQRKSAASVIRLVGNLRGKVCRNALDILHHHGGRVEDVAIDVL